MVICLGSSGTPMQPWAALRGLGTVHTHILGFLSIHTHWKLQTFISSQDPVPTALPGAQHDPTRTVSRTGLLVLSLLLAALQDRTPPPPTTQTKPPMESSWSTHHMAKPASSGFKEHPGWDLSPHHCYPTQGPLFILNEPWLLPPLLPR